MSGIFNADARDGGDPSLRLKNGYAQDDAIDMVNRGYARDDAAFLVKNGCAQDDAIDMTRNL
jgi:hypothetical protein